MNEFRPPQVRSRARLVLGLVLLPVGVLPVLLAGPLLLGRPRIVYTIDQNKLTVFTGGVFDRQRSVPLRELRSGRDVAVRRGSRSWGTALPGYCVGRFSYEDLGPVWQATSCSRRGVLLKLRDGTRPWLLSPPDGLEFLARLNAGLVTTIELPPVQSSTFARVMGPLFLGLLLLIAAVEVLIVLGPSRLSYVVRDDFVEVRTLFVRRRWLTAGMRARRHRPRVTLRLAGSAMPGYYTGIFRADGKTTRLYATTLEEGVLLEGPARVYLSPADPTEFLDALHRAGATVAGFGQEPPTDSPAV